MSKESKVAKEKDDILRMARDRRIIYKSKSDPDRYKRVCSLACELKAQGYINLSDTTECISLWLTSKGEVFLENGGNEDIVNTTKNEKRKSFWQSVLGNVMSKAIIGIGGLAVGYYIPRECPGNSPNNVIYRIQDIQHSDSSSMIGIVDSIRIKNTPN